MYCSAFHFRAGGKAKCQRFIWHIDTVNDLTPLTSPAPFGWSVQPETRSFQRAKNDSSVHIVVEKLFPPRVNLFPTGRLFVPGYSSLGPFFTNWNIQWNKIDFIMQVISAPAFFTRGSSAPPNELPSTMWVLSARLCLSRFLFTSGNIFNRQMYLTVDGFSLSKLILAPTHCHWRVTCALKWLYLNHVGYLSGNSWLSSLSPSSIFFKGKCNH